jgi:hypothetical protein
MSLAALPKMTRYWFTFTSAVAPREFLAFVEAVFLILVAATDERRDAVLPIQPGGVDRCSPQGVHILATMPLKIPAKEQ